MVFVNPFTAGRTIREQRERIQQLEAETARQERENDAVWAAYIIEKKLRRLEKEQD